jgi:hypothetical protein
MTGTQKRAQSRYQILRNIRISTSDCGAGNRSMDIRPGWPSPTNILRWNEFRRDKIALKDQPLSTLSKLRRLTMNLHGNSPNRAYCL